MGFVYEARHLRLKQRVAIKLLKPDLLAHPDCVTRFDREAHAAAKLRCSNVARIFDVDHTRSGIPYMVIEFLEGHDLSQELAKRSTLPPAEAVDVVLQACLAMSEAHTLGIVHRDLKPANLFLCGRGHVKVLDFGISKVIEEDVPQMTTPSLALGTPHYMSPEQILASKDVDTRADIWSLGVILFKAIAGRFPFEGESSTALVVAIATTEPARLEAHADVPRELADATMKALVKDRNGRWARVEDFARAIQPFGTGKVSFPPPGLASPPAPSGESDLAATLLDVPGVPALPTEGNWTQPTALAKARPWRARALAGVVAALLGLGAFALVRYAGPKPRALATTPLAETRLPPPKDTPPDPSAAPPPPSVALPASPPADPSATGRPPQPPPRGRTTIRRPPVPAPSAAPVHDPLHL
jgi:serine/threonine-protein kinase